MEKELVKLQEWVRIKKLRVVVLFEGRDAAGKGGVIKTISGCLNPRQCRVVALAAPTEREKGQWYFVDGDSHLHRADEDVEHAHASHEPVVRTQNKVGRNDPCPCGSEKKFKKCCLGKDSDAPQ